MLTAPGRSKNRTFLFYTDSDCEKKTDKNSVSDQAWVHTELGGRSSPCTPPPLRAVKLTPNETAEKITGLINDVKAEAAKKPPPFKHAEGVIDNLATHDYKIRKFKNVKPMKWSAAFAKNASQQVCSHTIFFFVCPFTIDFVTALID